LPTQKDSIILGEQTLSSSYTYHDGLGTWKMVFISFQLSIKKPWKDASEI
jgi:hypothetical protein